MFNKPFATIAPSLYTLRLNPQKNFLILNPCYQRVKKNIKKKNKKRLQKACEKRKDCYFCTRIRAEVHTQTEELNKSKKLLKKLKKDLDNKK